MNQSSPPPGPGPITGPGAGPVTGPGAGPGTGPVTGPGAGPVTGPEAGPGDSFQKLLPSNHYIKIRPPY